MKINPYLNFNGNCREAFQTYARILGGQLSEFHTFGSMPPGEEGMPPGFEDKIMHVALELDNATLMGSDSPPGMYQTPQGTSVSVHTTDRAAGERVFNDLAQGGHVIMPFQQTFWAEGFGMCVDRFGTPWMVNCEKSGQ